MWLKVLLFLAILAVTFDNSNGMKSYKGYKIYYVDTDRNNNKQYEDLNEIHNMLRIDFWLRSREMSHIFVQPEVQPAFEKELRLRNLPFTVETYEEFQKRVRAASPPRVSPQ